MENFGEQILQMAKLHGLIRSRDLVANGFPRIALTRLVQQGKLQRVDRGLYALPSRHISEHGTLAEVAKKYPQSVICLLSALQVHQLTTQAPFEVWLGIPNKAHAPQPSYPPLRIVRLSDTALEQGIEVRQIDGIPVRITTIERTLVDCFKFRNKIGLDVALEALTEAWRAKRINMDDLWRHASKFRMSNVMRPYIESLV
ncbi:Transcriptional regulator, AbiEi antitoxin, Type IV TA system [Duganella sp. CF458]|uniref:type IV toxin-antitoxin system AbiEi family antitoxin domain-containing protein n=1 Tax=Duganella sp. CF458 TaxID=1884368 RepID=UPI0008E81BC5|nr:type IV toxin-antitoxin system AbiEi family antitoxin domain-containing protein [Duganella sp. CF458]SFF85160.1 Transcriptional regulator, AbiEi antitoxin, Type IV TA system [Duganella sp. CF458]